MELDRVDESIYCDYTSDKCIPKLPAGGWERVPQLFGRTTPPISVYVRPRGFHVYLLQMHIPLLFVVTAIGKSLPQS